MTTEGEGGGGEDTLRDALPPLLMHRIASEGLVTLSDWRRLRERVTCVPAAPAYLAGACVLTPKTPRESSTVVVRMHLSNFGNRHQMNVAQWLYRCCVLACPELERFGRGLGEYYLAGTCDNAPRCVQPAHQMLFQRPPRDVADLDEETRRSLVRLVGALAAAAAAHAQRCAPVDHDDYVSQDTPGVPKRKRASLSSERSAKAPRRGVRQIYVAHGQAHKGSMIDADDADARGHLVVP